MRRKAFGRFIVADPRTCHGQPVFKRSRHPAPLGRNLLVAQREGRGVDLAERELAERLTDRLAIARTLAAAPGLLTHASAGSPGHDDSSS
jgi:hypothetical protein